ncbi:MULTISPECIES: A/G-specific adenine glycosylase [Streptomyces]|uniref:Adenine DNA glycosylase n=1 Tax=Streptomyces albus TaxID=1888 RepID=A0A6C1C5K5_9ACTN|nr:MULTISPECIES: A/G-specific adenine glycosylase [Streptomyces]KPC74383.1 adenine glycosylase [Streptomyces sp. NRRL F-6602]EPD89756.1 A/G-specific adenine glycosylase [Streptomyces sp. HPH0547]MDI6413421.1 A/G-specific adenine glycosylase [Streptomyces albus]QID37580.1 A/G-specific adenine glycosylase [Streptomyces albus]TGG81955.1 A/G-specific adenine glycosylase [Streptomyces albus]
MTATTETPQAASAGAPPARAADTEAVDPALRETARALHTPVVDWFATHARDLPWRRPEAGAWGVMVSEFMLQQTPVSRVLPVYEEWMKRWPRPADLAAEAPGEAVRAWGRLGYPRRALRLHGAAKAIAERHGGEVPVEHAQLLALPGVGEYTAAAVVSFAYGKRHAVLDTNVRRVFARAVNGKQYPPNATTAAERKLARALLPEDDETASRWAAATMELGALVCTARNPQCGQCPIAARCAWQLAGAPAHQGPARRTQAYAGTDRQVRGRLLAVLRAAKEPVPQADLDRVWHEPVQRARALDGLVADGLVEPLDGKRYRLPLT